MPLDAWDAWGPVQDMNSTRVMNTILSLESLQLIILGGDLITGENAYLFNGSHYIDEIVAPLVAKGLPYASVYGNHDHQHNLSSSDILLREHRYRNSLTRQMVFGKNSGVSNYYLPIFPSTGDQTPALLLWFFDSRGGVEFQKLDAQGNTIPRPDWVDPSVVSWFKKTRQALQDQHKKLIPSLAFVHIPINASLALQETGVNPHREPGINDDVPLAQQAQGWCTDGVNNGTCAYGGQDVPFMEALASTPGLMAVFSGHDHGDSWCSKWDKLLPGMTAAGNNITLCFGQHSGYGGYGSWTRGSRQIFVTEESLLNEQIDTWIRLETGDVVGAVTLNSTYGQDIYPATPNTYS